MKKNIFFGGCGGLYHYFLGISKIIQDEYDITDVNFSGISAGNVPAVLLALNINIEEYFNLYDLVLLENVRNKFTKSIFNWNDMVKEVAFNILPDDVYIKLSNNFKSYVTILPYFENKVVSNWNNKEDFIDTFIGSSFLPLFDKKLYQTIKINDIKYYCIDGTLSNYKANIDEDTTLQINTDMWREMKNSWMWLFTDKEWAIKLYNWGKEDALSNLDVFNSFGLIKKNKDSV